MNSCTTCLIGKISAVIGAVAVIYGMLMSIGIFPAGMLLNITAGGALSGAITFFLMATAFFLWPCGADEGDE
ncbi:hypothetical protein ACFL6T_06945 [Candidatus Zixiibacteriota bacterium]